MGGVSCSGGVAKQGATFPHWVWRCGRGHEATTSVVYRGGGRGQAWAWPGRGRGLAFRYRQNGEILPLAALTYGSLGVALAGLLLAVLVLSALRGLSSNRHSIRRHGACALLLAQLVFLLGINQAELPVGAGPGGGGGAGRTGVEPMGKWERCGDEWGGIVGGGGR